MVANMENFFDLYDIFVNELVGDIWLFIFLGLILIWFVSIKSKMTTEVSVMFAMLFLGAIFAHIYFEIIWVFIVLGAGAFFYFKVQKAMG